MNHADLDQTLQNVAIPNNEVGRQRDELRGRLVAALAAGAKPAGLLRRRWTLAIALLLIAAAAGATAPYWVSRLFSTYGWFQNDWMADAAPLDGLPEEYQAEARALWEQGNVNLLSRSTLPDGSTCYQLELVFQDGFRQQFNSALPPEPALRAELQQLVERGEGRVGSTSRQDSGLFVYLNLYMLSNGDVIGMGSSFPPMSREQQEQAQQYVDQQTSAAGGSVVGRLDDKYVVEYSLPDGRPFTTIRMTPPAELTEARENEIFAMKSAGGGRLIRHGVTSLGDVYQVEYTLSDGSIFQLGQTRPPMTDAAWESLRASVQALYAAGKFERVTVRSVDGKDMPVLRFTLPDGQVYEVTDIATTRVVWGLD